MSLIFWIMVLVIMITTIFNNVFKDGKKELVEEKETVYCNEGFKLKKEKCIKKTEVLMNKLSCKEGTLIKDTCRVKLVGEVVPKCPYNYTGYDGKCIRTINKPKVEKKTCEKGFKLEHGLCLKFVEKALKVYPNCKAGFSHIDLDKRYCYKSTYQKPCDEKDREMNNLCYKELNSLNPTTYNCPRGLFRLKDKCYEESRVKKITNCHELGMIEKTTVCEKVLEVPKENGCVKGMSYVDGECIKYEYKKPEVIKECKGEGLILEKNKCYLIEEEEPLKGRENE